MEWIKDVMILMIQTLLLQFSPMVIDKDMKVEPKYLSEELHL